MEVRSGTCVSRIQTKFGLGNGRVPASSDRNPLGTGCRPVVCCMRRVWHRLLMPPTPWQRIQVRAATRREATRLPEPHPTAAALAFGERGEKAGLRVPLPQPPPGSTTSRLACHTRTAQTPQQSCRAHVV